MAKEIENPCVATCQLNSELCVSCGRSKQEIRTWKRMKRPEKMATVQKAALRLKALKKPDNAPLQRQGRGAVNQPRPLPVHRQPV